MNSQEIKISLILMGIYTSRLLGLFLLFPIFSLLASGYVGSTEIKIGIALGIYSLSQALFQIPIGFLSDKFGRKKVLISALGIFFLGSLITVFASHIDTVIIGRLVQGAGAVSAVCLAYIGDSIKTENQPKTMAMIGGGIGLSFILSFILAPIISQAFGIQGIFLLITALSIFAFLVAMLLPKKATQKQFNHQDFISAIKQPKLLSINWQVALLHLTLSASFFAIPKLLSAHIQQTNFVYWYLPAVILAFIAVLPLIRNTHKQSFNKAKIQWFILTGSLVLFGLLPAFKYQWIFIICLGLFFFAFTYLEAVLPSQLFTLAPDTSRGTNSGIFSVHQFMGSFLGGVFGASLYTIFEASDTINYIFFVLAGIGLVAVLLIQFTFKKHKKTGK